MGENPSVAEGLESGDGVFGLILAGGRSERMGRDKAALPWPPAGPGWTVVDHLAARVGGLARAVGVASGASAVALPKGAQAVADSIPGAGPLAAIAGGLEAARAQGLEVVLCVACDMPLVTHAELGPPLDAIRAGADAAFWVVGGRDQPLCGAYSVALAERAARVLDAGARRVVALLEGPSEDPATPRVVRLVADENSRGRLVNLNTPTDYDRALDRRSEPPQGAGPLDPSTTE